MRRRNFLPIAATPLLLRGLLNAQTKGRLKQGVTRGVFARERSLEDCCREAAKLGIQGFDLIGPADWPLLKKYGLVPSMYPPGPGGSIPDALNRTENHDKLEKSMAPRSTNQPSTPCPTSSPFREIEEAWTTPRVRIIA
jgi:hydroxypyruvate isomerase